MSDEDVYRALGTLENKVNLASVVWILQAQAHLLGARFGKELILFWVLVIYESDLYMALYVLL